EIYYSLLRRAAPQMRRLFKIGLRDTLRQIQVYSVIGAGQIGDTTAIDRIAPLLQKPSWRLKYHALNSVAKLKLNPLVKAVSNLLDAKEHVYVRQAAIRTLGELGSSSVSKRLMRFLKDENANLRTVALVALGKIKGQNFLPQVGSFAQSENHCLRIAAAQAYAVIATDDAISKLIAMYADSVAAVRAEVLSHVLATDIDSLVYQFIRYGFTDPDMVPLTLACSKVAEDTNKLLLPEMCAQFWRKKSPYLYEIKTTILDALLEFDDSLEADRQIVEIIDAGLEDKLYAIRKRAAALAQQLSLKYEEKEPHYASEITAGNYGDHFAAYETNPRALIKTNRGTITVELLYFAAPKTALNYIRLASSGFYDNRVWHRVIPDFVIQDGCPRGDGCGGPGYEIRCEYNDRPFGTGSVGMATSGKDTGGSQYFICQSPQPHLDGRYTLFGQVIKGMSVVMKTEVGDSILSVQILPQ
ncbi:MAG: peptidylprolyl isomerase, partial [candidate division Zixibacteria bacterium]|nr:peptidylprolyl isomerase [candidate division Zixibacteria bacterium]